jgi:hypothetical protein
MLDAFDILLIDTSLTVYLLPLEFSDFFCIAAAKFEITLASEPIRRRIGDLMF